MRDRTLTQGHRHTGAMCSGMSKPNLSPTKLPFGQGSQIKFFIFKHQVEKSMIFKVVFLSFRFFSFDVLFFAIKFDTFIILSISLVIFCINLQSDIINSPTLGTSANVPDVPCRTPLLKAWDNRTRLSG